MPRWNTLQNRHLPERKGWALYRKVSKLWLSPKEGWRKMKGANHWKTGIFLRGTAELFTEGWVSCCWVSKRDGAGWKVQIAEKRASSVEERLSSLPKGEWAVAESQRGMAQRMRKMTARQPNEIEKKSINIMLDAT